MSKLWEKGYSLDKLVETYMTGDDHLLDQKLLSCDCLGSIAHARMLHRIGILTQEELTHLVAGLEKIMQEAEMGRFIIRPEDEDVHTAVENALTRSIGELGKKLHTARSRNDQILLDLRLYMRDSIKSISQAGLKTVEGLIDFAETHAHIPMPGRTHFQRAMPSSVGLWAGAFAEALLDDLTLLKLTGALINQCPLGSAASYGVSLPIDRQYVSDLLGFRCVQNNVLYANNSRGKFESMALNACVQIMTTLSKLATDVVLFSAPEFGYLTLPEKFCPGSSLMPQKRNPCPFELMRAKASTVAGCMNQILETIRGLPSGYNRDFQETKRPLMMGLEITEASLKVCATIVPEIRVNGENCLQAFTPELFATDEVLKRAMQGVPFREAYRLVAEHPEQVPQLDPVANIASKTHLGATGNLGLEISRARIQNFIEF